MKTENGFIDLGQYIKSSAQIRAEFVKEHRLQVFLEKLVLATYAIITLGLLGIGTIAFYVYIHGQFLQFVLGTLSLFVLHLYIKYTAKFNDWVMVKIWN
jgi:hypothetical protein